MKRISFFAFLMISACESGTSRSVDVTIPAEVTSGFTPQAPALLVADPGGRATAFVVLCGQSLPSPIELSQDLGFGCLKESRMEGDSETIRAWVQPLPADAGVACSASRQFYSPLGFPPDGGVTVLPQPEPTWAQGSASGTWRRDFSPCGGVLNASITIAAP